MNNRETEELNPTDTERLDWLEGDESKSVVRIGKYWYTRIDWGMPHIRRKNIREAIDAAIVKEKTFKQLKKGK